jgi:hypothetical protein
MNYLRSFVIGSSFPVFLPFFLTVRLLLADIKNYDFENYAFVAPLYLGLMNMFSLFISTTFNLSLRHRFIFIGILSPLIVILVARILNSYDYTTDQWNDYYGRIILKHFIIYNLVIYNLERMI